MSTFGQIVQTTLLGESHGALVGVLLHRFPAGVAVDEARLDAELLRRRPGQSAVTTQRSEQDAPEFLAGVHDGETTGAPLLVVARNADKDSSKYRRELPRPGHSDLAGYLKFFGHNDYRGAGHFGGRLTFGLVAAGALARMALDRFGTRFSAYTEEIGGIGIDHHPPFDEARDLCEANDVRAPDPEAARSMRAAILATRNAGDSLGGVVRCRIRGVPVGLGGYHAQSFESRMGSLMFGIPAVKGVGFGHGFALARLRGTQANDSIGLVDGRPQAVTSQQGGTVGGVTDGSEVSFHVAFKPTASVLVAQDTVNLDTGRPETFTLQGRHDPCIVPRAVPVVENAAALAVLDMTVERLGETAFDSRKVAGS